MKYKLCPKCLSFVRLTKKGAFYRHGFKMIHCRRSWAGFDLESGYNCREIKSPCEMSGKILNEVEKPSEAR